MNSINPSLYKKIEKIAGDVFKSLKTRGVVVPMDNPDGTISFDQYVVERVGEFYTIRDRGGYAVAEGINLPHTAILLANKLALTNFVDAELLKHDREYGFKLFDEENFARSASNAAKQKDWDKVELLEYRQMVASEKKEQLKKKILVSFEKLKQNNK